MGQHWEGCRIPFYESLRDSIEALESCQPYEGVFDCAAPTPLTPALSLEERGVKYELSQDHAKLYRTPQSGNALAIALG
jgi:hypothetical protein